jgi:hypothetical protein
MTDEEKAATRSSLAAKAMGRNPRDPAPATGGAGGLASNLLGSTSATIGGIGKGLAQIGAPPGGASLREADPKGPVATWAKTEDKDYPTAEKAGRLAAQYGPLAMIPSVGLEGLAAKTIPEFPRVAGVIGKGLEGTWKGGVGGATQGDPKTGAEVGGGTAAGSAAFMAAPGWLKSVLAMGALMGGREMTGGRLPWGAYHMAHPLALLAAAALGRFPGLSGAFGAKALGDGSGDKP